MDYKKNISIAYKGYIDMNTATTKQSVPASQTVITSQPVPTSQHNLQKVSESRVKKAGNCSANTGGGAFVGWLCAMYWGASYPAPILTGALVGCLATSGSETITKIYNRVITSKTPAEQAPETV
ncbi:hypothetical protein J7438_19600 [Thalassotalea sp. G20_0]|uniref:hypothetical protein n=1 Tax=Thalassotalea sp. G20_0 TaxID=2821093 RepID=UPI001ADA9538|nr:hypothetical protein [Thalassotalea sp. G20_0]MBO9496264.1 hypothetical protein [Thalassotalea sp. G20_0]